MTPQQERTNFWTAQSLNTPVEALTATYITHSFSRHTHEGFAIGVIERGAETFYYRGDIHVAPAGSVVVINPAELHTGQAVSHAGWSYRMFYPEASLLARVASQMKGHSCGIPFFPRPVIEDSVLFHALQTAHVSLEQSPDSLERDTRFITALSLMIRHHADDIPPIQTQDTPSHPVTHAQDYIHSHYDDDISLEQLAQTVHLSPYHLTRLFRQQLGLPPHAYLNQVRVHHAKKLLSIGTPIAEVAQITGFSDQSHLNKAFKRIVGVSPGQYSKIRQDSQL
ncbi:MAG: AraC family transcriptional regulator [Anaerolineae bacterium]